MKRLPPQTEELIPLLIAQWRKLKKTPGPPDRLQTREFRSVVADVQKLRTGWQAKGNFWGGDPLKDPDFLGAYLLYYWPIHYQEALSFLSEIPTTPRRVLDLCSGAAPFAYAALKHGAQEVIAFDRNREALNLGAQICGRNGFPLSLRFGDVLTTNWLSEKPFDLITLGYGLFDLFPPITLSKSLDRAVAFVKRLVERLKPEGHLLLVESSETESNRLFLRIRDRLVQEGVFIHAPCIWQGNCPALDHAGAPCYAQREMEKPLLIKELQRAAEINLSSLKASYLILRGAPAAVYTGKPFYRVISPAFDSPQGKTYYLCGTESKKVLVNPLKTAPAKSKAFDQLRRGDVVTYQNVLEEGSKIALSEESSLTVCTPPDQPPPQNSNQSELNFNS